MCAPHQRAHTATSTLVEPFRPGGLQRPRNSVSACGSQPVRFWLSQQPPHRMLLSRVPFLVNQSTSLPVSFVEWAREAQA